jgi:hypothetical protein
LPALVALAAFVGGCPISRDRDADPDVAFVDTGPVDAGGLDTPALDAVILDAPVDVRTPPDTSWTCTIDEECLAMHNCESYWACRPGEPLGDAHGCVELGGPGWCPFGQLCSEVTRECTTCRDEDGDRFTAAACGGSDCDDHDPETHPGALDGCRAGDGDCDGDVDEDPDVVLYRDEDGDGYAPDDPFIASFARCRPLPNWASSRGDCYDAEPTVHPGAIELCDGFDTDCNSLLDFPGEDDDRDGYSDPACWSAAGQDCDDEDPTRYWGAYETMCELVDRDCDGHVWRDYDADGVVSPLCGGGDCNDGDPAVGAEVDFDGDGHFDRLCPMGDDCDDRDRYAYAGAPEICNRRIDGCDRSFGVDNWDEDGDGDGFAPVGATCRDDVPGAFPRTDCDDFDARIAPGQPELCDDLDNDCDAATADGSAPVNGCAPGESCVAGACS